MAKHPSKTEISAAPTAGFDRAAAKESADSFSFSCGVGCALYAKDGAVLYHQGPGTHACEVCRRLSALTGAGHDCASLHTYGAFQSERFGGRYIYFCPIGLAFFASPIMTGSAFAGALVGGPVRIMDAEDFLAADALHLAELPTDTAAQIREGLLTAPQREPRILEHLSAQLFANAVYIGDSSHELFQRREAHAQQNMIGDYIARLKRTGTDTYPIETENRLYDAISDGDRLTASTLLNELLGYIYFHTAGPEEIRTRITELLVILSRAAIRGGANPDQILSISLEQMKEMRALRSQEELTRWLAESLNRYTNLVFTMLDGKHSNTMRAATGYIKAHYAEKLTLEEAALQAGYSPSYFSRIFREELGCTFKEYLTAYRIEQSKRLLLSGEDSVSDICSVVGFSDESYFCRIFRERTGTTPDRFRKRVRRIDTEKELGAL